MDPILYCLALGLVKFLQALPLSWVARIGRTCGGAAYWLDQRHRRMALRNLAMCFGSEKSPGEIRNLARENFRRLGENYCSAVKTAAMKWDELKDRVEFVRTARIQATIDSHPPQSHIVAIGHFGNFELYARFGEFIKGLECAATYRALRPPSLNRLMQSLRAHSGCRFFERRTEAQALKTALSQRSMLLGLLADQHSGAHGVRAPFLGQDCSTTAAPAVLALRFGCRLHTGICYRVGLGRWRIEAGDEIPTLENGQKRSVEAITLDINNAFEAAIRRDPANWFWVHNRWKPARTGAPKAPDDTQAESASHSESLRLS